MSNASSETVPFVTLAESTFNSDLHLSVVSSAPEGSDFTVDITPTLIPAPGLGEGLITIRTGPMTFPRDYFVTVIATSVPNVYASTFIVRVECTPPFILGVDQPVATPDASGKQVAIQAKASGSGPFIYQWYRGRPGMTFDPVGSDATLVVPNESNNFYWVRVGNACGSVDSVAARIP